MTHDVTVSILKGYSDGIQKILNQCEKRSSTFDFHYNLKNIVSIHEGTLKDVNMLLSFC